MFSRPSKPDLYSQTQNAAMDEADIEGSVHEIGSSLMAVRRMLDPVAASVAGFQREARENGMSEDAAETMALVYYEAIIEMLFNNVKA